MSVIENVVITGFWSDRTIDLSFKPNVNFLIGQNGSGKTTAINIIAAALSCEFEDLDRLPFDKIDISLYDRANSRKPKIVVEKKYSSDTPFPEIVYTIRETTRAKPRSFSLVDYAEERYLRGPSSRLPRSQHRHLEHLTSDLREVLSKLVPTSWLSVHRTNPNRDFPDRYHRDYVDAKLREISNRLVRYFSELTAEANAETRRFQRKLFLSLIDVDSKFEISKATEKIELEKERQALIEIYKRFDVPERDYRQRTDRFFDKLAELQSDQDKDAFTLPELVTMLNGSRIHSLIDEWQSTMEAEQSIVMPRDRFIEIINDMLHRKQAEILRSGDLIFTTDSGKKLPLTDLSSGEKQLLVILSEALLQTGEWVYIADEPELSLHIDWQEVLVDNLVALNPNSQILFATHSPDIVSHFSDSVIDMESVLK